MPDQLQLRGGTTTEHNSFTGAAREVTVDTTKKTLVVHDGSQAGGTPLMKESGATAASSITLGTGGTNAVTIDSNQNVGIGITSPNNTTKLHIAAPQTGTAAGTGLTISGWNGSAEARVQLMSFGVGGGTLAIRSGTSNTERLRMDQSGNFGIGTSSPIYKLDVSGSIRATSQGRFGNGTASEPAYSFNGDSDTGMYRSTTNVLSFATGGGERIQIDAVGNMTIKGGQSLFFHNGFNNSTSRIQNAGASNNSTLRFLTRENGTEGERMVITAGGAVGIGVSGPSGACKLEIGGKLMFSGLDTAFVSSARPAIFRTGSTSGSYPFNAFGHLVLQTRGDGSNRDIVFATGSNGVNKTVVTAAGNVGIGNNGPTHKLEVASAAPIIAIRATTASSTSTGKLHFINLDGNSIYRDVCQIEGKSSGNGGYGELKFKTAFNNSLLERMIIDQSGHLMLGTTTKGHGNGDNLTIADGGNCGITIRGGNTGVSSIYFARDNSSTASFINYNHSSNAVFWYVNSDLAFQIDSNQMVTLGKTSWGGSSGAKVFGNAGGIKKSSLLVLNSTASVAGRGGGVAVGGNTGPLGSFYASKNGSADSSGGSCTIESVGNLSFATAGDMTTLVAPTPKMIIDTNGNVGIGHDSPSSFSSSANSLVISETTGNAGISINAAEANASSSVFFTDGTGSGANGIGRISYSHQDDSMAFWASGAQGMLLMKDGSHHELLLNTATQLAGATLSIHTNGTCGIGIKAGADNTQKHIAFANPNGEVGSITTNGSATSYQTSSDYRLKENAVAIADGITRLKTLIPYRFNFKSDPSTKVDGFFAHEVTAVPEAVTGTKDEVDSNNNPIYQGIDQSKLVPLLVAAVKELIGKVEALEAA